VSFPNAENGPDAGRMPSTGAPPGAGAYSGADLRPRADAGGVPGGAPGGPGPPPQRPGTGGASPEWGPPPVVPSAHPAEGILTHEENRPQGAEPIRPDGPPAGMPAGMPGEAMPGQPPGVPGDGAAPGEPGTGAERPTGPLAHDRTEDIATAAIASLPKASTVVFDRDMQYVLVAGRAPGHHGMKPDEIEGQLAEEVLGPDWWEIYGPLYNSALDGDTRSLEIWSNDGTRCFLAEVGPLYDPGQEVVGGVAVFRDITKRKRADEARFEAEERFELVFEQGPTGMALLTVEGRWTRVNQALVEITGHTSEALVSKSIQELTYPDDRSNDIDELRALVEGDISEYRIEKRMFHARGHVISVVLWVSLVRDRAGKPQNLIAQVQDITERKLMEERLHNLAEHDGLTGLLNRRLFEHEVGLQVDRVRRSGGTQRRGGEGAALVIVDLDNFRAVNESAGHRTGDELLKSIAVALQERLRGTDMIARLDGDEFGVLLRGLPMNAAEAVANGLRQVVADCGVEIAGRQVSCTASIGLASIDPEVESDDAVRAAAEQDMFAEKQSKRRSDDEPETAEELPGETFE
jgi:diguanylate cyclase (GGDEF)-like protein/PAS domain S-box-containing protein